MLKNNFGLWLNHLEQWRNWKFIIKYHRERKKCICALVITLNLQYIQYWEALTSGLLQEKDMTLFSKLLKKMWKELRVGTMVQICESLRGHTAPLLNYLEVDLTKYQDCVLWRSVSTHAPLLFISGDLIQTYVL